MKVIVDVDGWQKEMDVNLPPGENKLTVIFSYPIQSPPKTDQEACNFGTVDCIFNGKYIKAKKVFEGVRRFASYYGKRVEILSITGGSAIVVDSNNFISKVSIGALVMEKDYGFIKKVQGA